MRPSAEKELVHFDLRAAARRAMQRYGFDTEVPRVDPQIASRAATIDAPGGAPELRDLRALRWSSVDNRTSRDLDQIEVAEQLADGVIRLLVGVADVDSLVAKATPVDDHAARNTTSVYAGVIVFPMLPEILSTDLTSLGEGDDRRALVVELEIASNGTVTGESIYPALVRNHGKLVYEDVADWWAGGAPPPPVKAVPELEVQLGLQRECARRLRASPDRVALDIESVEPQLVVAGDRVIDIRSATGDEARELIEALMIAANSAMARFLDLHNVPAIRRVVRTPRKWDRIVALAADLGETLPAAPDRGALAGFLARRKSADPEHFPDLSLAVVKLLGPGEYVLERRMDVSRRDGHFGLGVADYVHSTAPNRRFADLVIQRLAKRVLGIPTPPYSDDELNAIAQRCTERAQAAQKVERLVRKQAAALFMRDRIGDEFTAMVTGASPKGTYARVLNPPVEGRIVRGEQGLDVGDTVRLKLVRTDAERGLIDFEGPAAADLSRKLARSRRKRAWAEQLRPHVGESFTAEVTKAAPDGSYVRLLERAGEGRVIRGQKALRQGQHVVVKLTSVNPVHGFIDFEYSDAVDDRKRGRLDRKRRWAGELRDRIGERFAAVVSAVTPNAVWVKLTDSGIEGRLVRGTHGLAQGDSLTVILLATDSERGYVDFAREDQIA